jgi:O-6-methylguanine DNA methyltransferase
MDRAAYTLFESPIGTCGIAWMEPMEPAATGPAPVIFFQLPPATASAVERSLARHVAAVGVGTPASAIDDVIARIRKHLSGELQDFRNVDLDLDRTGEFERQVYRQTREIPAGQTRTYGEVARLLGEPAAARAVGQALGRNPIPLIIPCHRVLGAGRKYGGFSAPGGVATKLKLLRIERARAAGPTNLSFDFAARGEAPPTTHPTNL